MNIENTLDQTLMNVVGIAEMPIMQLLTYTTGCLQTYNHC